MTVQGPSTTEPAAAARGRRQAVGLTVESLVLTLGMLALAAYASSASTGSESSADYAPFFRLLRGETLAVAATSLVLAAVTAALAAAPASRSRRRTAARASEVLCVLGVAVAVAAPLVCAALDDTGIGRGTATFVGLLPPLLQVAVAGQTRLSLITEQRERAVPRG